MRFKKLPVLCGLPAAIFGLACAQARAQPPANFPDIAVTTYDSNKAAEGCIFLASFSQTPGTGSFLMILDNDGTPVAGDKYLELAAMAGDFKVQPNGLLSYAQTYFRLPYTGGWDVEHILLDETMTTVVETLQMRNGYVAEFHDFQLLPNGHALALGYYLSEVDLSGIVSGGNPGALVSGTIIQELDAQRNAVFQWRSWDHYDFEDHSYGNGAAATYSRFHVNDLNLDVDGHLIAGTPEEIRKINRQSGEVMWTLGGPHNEFTAAGPGANAGHFGGHGTYRLENGNFLMYDNSEGVVTSQVHEYALDETAKIATHVWSYVPPTFIGGQFTGNAQRLPNGNTLICWGLPRTGGIPVCTEVTPSGEKVFELTFSDTSIQSYRAFRFPFPSSTRNQEFRHVELAAGNTYDFTGTGVRLDVTSGGGGYNEVKVTRQPYAPVLPSFITLKAPGVVATRVVLSAFGVSSMTAKISFDARDFGLANPQALTVYHRPTPGSGLFVALPTDPYNPLTRKVRATMSQFGEFILGYPDLEDVAHSPILHRPESYSGLRTNLIKAPRKAEDGVVYTVNQERPVALSWSPRGLARYHEIQVDTEASFASPVVNRSFQSDAYHVLSNALPNTIYHWRARSMVQNNGLFVTGDWSSGAFQTIPPELRVVSPNGSEAWQRGLMYFVHWNDNLAEDVALDLYKGGVFLRTLSTNANTHVFRWEVDLDLEPGNDYTIRARSVADPGLLDTSDAPFSIDPPRFDVTSVTRLPDGRLQFEFTAPYPDVTQATVLRSTNLPVWEVLQTVPLSSGNALFIDESAVDHPGSFYLLRVP